MGNAVLDWDTGAWDGLAETLGELAGSEETHPMVRQAAKERLGLLDLARGNRGRAEQLLGDILEKHAGRGDSPASFAAAGLARLRLADGRVEEALHLTGPAVEMTRSTGVWFLTEIAPVHVDALVYAARLDEADLMIKEFASSWLRDRDAPAPAAALATCRAIVAEGRGDHGRAAALFAEAALAWAALPRPYDELLALEQEGRSLLLAAGGPRRALALLSDVQERLRALGAKWDADRVAQLLHQHGVEVPPVWRGGRRGYGDQLSPRELEVVELVARGMTNKQVAEVLFISRRLWRCS